MYDKLASIVTNRFDSWFLCFQTDKSRVRSRLLESWTSQTGIEGASPSAHVSLTTKPLQKEGEQGLCRREGDLVHLRNALHGTRDVFIPLGNTHSSDGLMDEVSAWWNSCRSWLYPVGRMIRKASAIVDARLFAALRQIHGSKCCVIVVVKYLVVCRRCFVKRHIIKTGVEMLKVETINERLFRIYWSWKVCPSHLHVSTVINFDTSIPSR